CRGCGSNTGPRARTHRTGGRPPRADGRRRPLQTAVRSAERRPQFGLSEPVGQGRSGGGVQLGSSPDERHHGGRPHSRCACAAGVGDSTGAGHGAGRTDAGDGRGHAAGTALTFAKLGAAVRTAGAIGTDPAVDVLLSLLGSAGIDTSLGVRKPDVPTSMSVLPIRPNGERPSLPLLGANLAYTVDDVDWDAVAASDH